MQLYKIRGGTVEDLEAKKYNIGVGISLGNKWFTVENIIELIRWSLLYTRENVIVYVADSIHAINLEVRKRIKYEKALQMAEQLGTDLLEQVRQEVEKTFSPEEISRIHYVKWSVIANNTFKLKVKFLYDFYHKNEEFKSYLQSIVKKAITKETSPRTFSESEIFRLADYIIEELPEQTTRVPMGDFSCDAFVYPYDGDIVELSEKIQRGDKFPEIRDAIIDTEPKVFIAVRNED